jgi:uncharacterized protein (TIGR00251 family)
VAGGQPEPPSGVHQPAWLHGRAGEWLIAVRAQPGARGAPGAEAHGDSLKVRVSAPAVDGKANAALIEWFAARLGLPARAFDWQSGQTARSKRLRVRCDLPAADLVSKLLQVGR